MTTTNLMDEWNELPWKQFERQVFKLQSQIYRASQRGDVKTLHRLQKLVMKSWAARCLAVRRVSQDNQGKKTAGVDGVKLITPSAALDSCTVFATFRKSATSATSLDTQTRLQRRASVRHSHTSRSRQTRSGEDRTGT